MHRRKMVSALMTAMGRCCAKLLVLVLMGAGVHAATPGAGEARRQGDGDSRHQRLLAILPHPAHAGGPRRRVAGGNRSGVQHLGPGQRLDGSRIRRFRLGASGRRPLASWSNWDPAARADVGFVYCHGSSLALAQLCLRGKFHVERPGQGAAHDILDEVPRRCRRLSQRQGACSQSSAPSSRAAARDPRGDVPARGLLPQERAFARGLRPQRLRGSSPAASPSQPGGPDPARGAAEGNNVLAIAINRVPLPKDVYQTAQGIEGSRTGLFSLGRVRIVLRAADGAGDRCRARQREATCRRAGMELEPAGVGHGPRLGRPP